MENPGKHTGANMQIGSYGRQFVDDEDIAAVSRLLRGDRLTDGPEVTRFEEALASITGAPHVVACANGTAALHLVSVALGLSPADTVIVPSISFVATANGFRLTGTQIVISDVDPKTGLMRPEDVVSAAARATTPVRAVVCMHYGGQTCDIKGLRQVADALGAVLIEDACHALGSGYRTELSKNGPWHSAGDCEFSDIACFSFHPVKNITTGEGGAVTTKDANLAERIRLLSKHGIVREPADFVDPDSGRAADGAIAPWYYEQQLLGFNYRLSDLQAALGVSQLRKLAQFKRHRAALVERYRELLESRYAQLVEPIPASPNADPCWHLMAVLIDYAALGKDRASVMRELRQHGIGTQVHYIPIHQQPYYRSLATPALPGAEAFYAKALSLPLHVGMDIASVDAVVDALIDCLGLARAH